MEARLCNQCKVVIQMNELPHSFYMERLHMYQARQAEGEKGHITWLEKELDFCSVECFTLWLQKLEADLP